MVNEYSRKVGDAFSNAIILLTSVHYALHVHAAVQMRILRFWKSEMQNAILILVTSRKKCPPRCARDQVRILQSWSSWEVMAKCAATSPCWCRTLWPPPIRTTILSFWFWSAAKWRRPKPNGQFVRNVTDKLSATLPVTNLTSRFHLAFLQFFQE